jgi:carbon-monoxide dehydrogenase medium subunit
LPAAALALGATLHVTGSGGSRTVSASDFFVDLMMTALQADEILTEIEISAAGAGTGSAYVKYEHPASGYALCGAAAVVTRGAGGSCTAASLCFNGVSATAVSAADAASSLEGSDLSDGAIDSAVSGMSIPDAAGDMFASAGYRQELAKTLGAQALRTARDRA